jgi:hypothetical protein
MDAALNALLRILRPPPAFGWPGVIALLALLLALPLALWATPHWQQQAEQLRRERLRRPPPPPPPAPPPEPTLPVTGESSQRVADLLALATRSNVAIDRTQQRSETSAQVRRLRLVLGAHGGYTELRSYIAAALQADPALALDRLRFSRPNATAGALQADLQWSLIEPAGGSASPAVDDGRPAPKVRAARVAVQAAAASTSRVLPR